MSIETWKADYPVVVEGDIQNHTLREINLIRQEFEVKPFIWSARLSTGILGLPDCKSGNSKHAPKGANEVVLAMGNEGLSKLVELGFIPCPTCHPENVPGFWDKARDSIMSSYPRLKNVKDFADKNIVPFDSLRVDWEALAPYLTALPNRLYVSEGLTKTELQGIKERFEKLDFKLPPVGYYINGAPWFREYEIK